MTRNTAREIATHLAYELSFTDLSLQEFLDQRLSAENFSDLSPECELYDDMPNAKQAEYIRRLVSGVADHAAELDGYIEKYAQGWRFDRISLVASAIMRVAMFEILYMPDIPAGVAINEAVEIAKKYEEPDTVRFLNGILGSFVREEVKE
ncbi:MAG: transcription antitermination factor NusB [Oscillospiraceae bacterium]|nr:transcription antitermination factor NusB [Oscillospiraceae bacterium]